MPKLMNMKEPGKSMTKVSTPPLDVCKPRKLKNPNPQPHYKIPGIMSKMSQVDASKYLNVRFSCGKRNKPTKNIYVS